jgi:hypothetical protein
MNTNKRIELVKAMEMLARAVNDERNILTWFTIGVADGDITENSVADDIEYYTDDETFAELMDTFLYVMENARRSGGLYFDGILSKEAE